MNIALAVLWIVATLIVVALAAGMAKRFGSAALIGLYAAMTLAATVTATKLVAIVGLDVTASIIIFSSTFLLTDIISECYGKRKAQNAVIIGFAGALIYALHAFITVKWPAVPYWENQKAYETIIGLSARIAIAGPVAYFVSQLLDVYLFHAIKNHPKSKHLWVRNIGSTSVSQLVDTTIFMVIAFAGLYPLLPLIFGTYVVKLAIAVIDTPFVYMARRIITGQWKGPVPVITVDPPALPAEG